MVHFANLLMQGFISKRFFANHFHNPSNSNVLSKPLVELLDFPSVVAQAHSHTLHPGNNSRQKTSQTKH
jgi:hypothetical protein